MTNHKSASVFALFAVLAVATAVPGQSIQDVTTGQYLFYDNYEEYNTVSTVPAPDTSGNYRPGPGAIIGSWVPNSGDAAVSTQVTNSHTGGDPGAFQGTQYLRMYRDTSNEGGNALAKDSATVAAGDTVEMRAMVYLPAGSDVNARAQIMMVTTTKGDGSDFISAPAWVRGDGAGNVDAVIGDGAGGGLTVVPTGLQYLTNTWQEWDLTYTNGASTFSVTVGGQTVSGIPSVQIGSVSGFQLLNGADTPSGSAYFDSINGINFLPGDLNQDGKVNQADYAILTSHWLQTGVTGANGDLSGDGTVNITDFSIFKQDYISANGAASASVLAVPEPGSLVLFSAALLAVLALPRRKK
ncbi:MAG TPA: dockerin type I repeat-containing protein [Pirellulales bacterium]|jgi:hypothetical protein